MLQLFDVRKVWTWNETSLQLPYTLRVGAAERTATGYHNETWTLNAPQLKKLHVFEWRVHESLTM